MKKLLLILLLTSVQFSQAHHPQGTVDVDVNGLVCDFCARALEKVFGKQPEVESIKVDLDNKTISIHFQELKQLDDKTITKLITDSGYNVEAIQHEKP